MKDYLNLFYGMIDKIHTWEDDSLELKASILQIFVDNQENDTFLAEYFEKYRLNLLNSTLNFYLKGVIKY